LFIAIIVAVGVRLWAVSPPLVQAPSPIMLPPVEAVEDPPVITIPVIPVKPWEPIPPVDRIIPPAELPPPEVVVPPDDGSAGYKVVGGFNRMILPGDTLWDMAEFYWGDPFLWPTIYNDNFTPPDPPDLLHPGNIIWIRPMIVGAD
jgi:hypothetical protein